MYNKYNNRETREFWGGSPLNQQKLQNFSIKLLPQNRFKFSVPSSVESVWVLLKSIAPCRHRHRPPDPVLLSWAICKQSNPTVVQITITNCRWCIGIIIIIGKTLAVGIANYTKFNNDNKSIGNVHCNQLLWPTDRSNNGANIINLYAFCELMLLLCYCRA